MSRELNELYGGKCQSVMLGRVFKHSILQRVEATSTVGPKSSRRFTWNAQARESFNAIHSRQTKNLDGDGDVAVASSDGAGPLKRLYGNHLGFPATFGEAASIHQAFIAFGSNTGHRVSHIEKALTEMEKRHLKIKSVSSLYETEPMYVTDQDVFLNGACEVSEIDLATPLTSDLISHLGGNQS
jgi:7,8-dihydro-6-hydroxymethylpterin-pyrophosphokinase (HPPK)